MKRSHISRKKMSLMKRSLMKKIDISPKSKSYTN